MGETLQSWYNNDELKQLVEIYGTTDKKEIQKLIKEKSLSKIEETKTTGKARKEYLANLKLTLDCWKGLLELRDSLPFKIDPIKILSGEENLPEPPVMQMLNNGTISRTEDLPSPNKISWVHFCKPMQKEREFSELTNQCPTCGEGQK